MPATPLTVHNAEIRTATVEIKTLTVSGKQVTLAVFRQLLEERPTDGAVPWGWINHCPDEAACSITACIYSGPHRHVVWQKGSELRRHTVWSPAPFTTPRQAQMQAEYDRTSTLPQLFIAV